MVLIRNVVLRKFEKGKRKKKQQKTNQQRQREKYGFQPALQPPAPTHLSYTYTIYPIPYTLYLPTTLHTLSTQYSVPRYTYLSTS